MSYPDPVYLDAAGEASATFRSADRPADVTYATGTTVHYLATGAATSGLYGLYRWDMSATHGGPGPHFHRTIAESFFVLSGAVRLFDGAAWVDGGPGDFLHVPPGGIHGFRNESGEPASLLIHFAPGAPREAYFEGLVGVGDMSDDERAEFYRVHDNIWIEGG